LILKVTPFSSEYGSVVVNLLRLEPLHIGSLVLQRIVSTTGAVTASVVWLTLLVLISTSIGDNHGKS
jgi:hypothetical protein